MKWYIASCLEQGAMDRPGLTVYAAILAPVKRREARNRAYGSGFGHCGMYICSPRRFVTGRLNFLLLFADT